MTDELDRVHSVRLAMAELERVMSGYAMVPCDEFHFQDQIERVLRAMSGNVTIDREVSATNGRFDIRARFADPPVTIVLELKVRGTAAAAERQAQRYAKVDGVDGVMIVTTSSRLGSQIKSGVIGGKPFRVQVIRGVI